MATTFGEALQGSLMSLIATDLRSGSGQIKIGK